MRRSKRRAAGGVGNEPRGKGSPINSIFPMGAADQALGETPVAHFSRRRRGDPGAGFQRAG